ncbi:hypothetical protein BDQ17DRAFT_1433217 [Cyathus striatus]|nr:hypothetical protein BDQ17DRAFT_1433217 [Cyathus striatus]
MDSELESLGCSLSHVIGTIQEEIKNHKLPELSNFAPAPHLLDMFTFDCPPCVFEACKLALGSLRPYERVVEQSTTIYETACLDLVVKTGIIDRLYSTSSSGISILQLQDEFDIDSRKLLPVLHYLAAQGWMHEVEEDLFLLTWLSLELIKGKCGRNWTMTPGKPKITASLSSLLLHPD